MIRCWRVSVPVTCEVTMPSGEMSVRTVKGLCE